MSIGCGRGLQPTAPCSGIVFLWSFYNFINLIKIFASNLKVKGIVTRLFPKNVKSNN